MTRARAALTAYVVAAALLTGCSTAEPTATSTPGPSTASTESPIASPTATVDLARELRGLETAYDARVGLSLLDTCTGERLSSRGSERFLYASTLKLFAVAELLRQVPPAGRGEVLTWSEADVAAAGYAPVTEQHVADGLSLAQLAEAALRESDNLAMNLVLGRLGGPSALDAALARLGDETTDVVDIEPALNEPTPGSTANTTTPDAFTADLAAVFADGYLEPADRALLLEWLSGNATGDTLVRAGAPAGWTVADKSGGAGPVRTDVAVVTPPSGRPALLTVLTRRNDPTAAYDDTLVARAAALALGRVSSSC